jgi:uncharacterized protein (TIGR04255 family)
MGASQDPFVAPPPAEVPLADAPLERVLVQVRFPEVLRVEDRAFVAPFQEAIRERYPVLRVEQTQTALFGPGGFVPGNAQAVWRFSDVDSHWRVSLAPDFAALETTKYSRRDDFVTRLKDVLRAVAEHVRPAVVDRLGVRYIGRITGPAVDDIATLVTPEVRGISGTSLAERAVHSLSETQFDLGDARFVARWGLLSAMKTPDPNVIAPIGDKSWILDLDVFSAKPAAFDVTAMTGDSRRYAERAYAFFRWAVTDEFLRRHGGQP